jgi:DHA1 family 2-module integral membrane pump EmrD-like MFS transporter
MKEYNKIVWTVMWLTVFCQAAMTIYLPAYPLIAGSLHINPDAVKTTLSVFLFGNGISQLAYGPLSERYGRKPLMLIGMAIFSAGCLLNTQAHTLFTFQMARLIQGIGSGCTIALCRAILRDRFQMRELASAASYLSMGFAIGLGFSPIIGAFLQNHFNWQADFYFLSIFGLLLLVATWYWLPETLVKKENDSTFNSFLMGTLRDYRMIIQDKLLWKFLVGGLFAYAVVITYNTMSPFLIQNVLGYSAVTFGWMSTLIAIPYYFAAITNRSLVLKIGSQPIFLGGNLVILFSGIFMLVMTLYFPISLAITIMLPIMLATFGQGFIWPNAIAGAMQHTHGQPGKTSAMFSSLQMTLISVVTTIIAYIPDNSPLFMGLVLIGLGILSGLILLKNTPK